MLDCKTLCIVAAYELNAEIYREEVSGGHLYIVNIPDFLGKPYYCKRKSWEELGASLGTLLDILDLTQPNLMSQKVAAGYLPAFSVN